MEINNVFNNSINNIVNELQAMEVDGETMQIIIERAGLDDQLLRQLVLTKPTELTAELLQEKKHIANQIK